MHDFHHAPDDDGQEIDAGSFGSGFSMLSKCLKAAFVILVVSIVCMTVWFFTYGGLIQVSPQESVILLRFGKFAELYENGWHWAFPYPVNTVVRVPTSAQSIRIFDFMPENRALIGDRKPGAEMMQNPDAPLVPGKDGYLITGDANIIHTEWEISYRISSPKTYFENCLTPRLLAGDDEDLLDSRTGANLGQRGPRTLIRDAFLNTVITVSSGWKAEDILRPKGGVNYADTVQAAFIKRVASLGIGITVDRVDLRLKSPPPQTIAAFEDVIVAEQQGSKEKEIARAYAIEQAASAEDGKSRFLADAIAYKRRVVADVAASEAVFAEILKQYKRSPDSVMVSLYSSALADALELAKDKFIIRRNGSGSQELRLKLNPEPPSPPKKDEARRDSK